jgi:beta-N-acetylhexosaminidase
MRAQRPPILKVLLILAGLAALATLGVFLIRGRHHTHLGTRTVIARQRPPSLALRPTPATGPPRHRSLGNRRSDALNPTTGAGATRQTGAKIPHAEPSATLDRTLGQMIVARFPGEQPSQAFLRRVRLGQIGGVILFADNLIGGPANIRALTQELQLAARQGGNPPLLVMADQEGGAVRRVPGAPFLAPREMGSAATALQQGRAAGALLRSVGINVDLAPVADVEVDPSSFLGTRAFGSSPALVADRACAFATGLAKEGVGYTLKHFPGLGAAPASTDDGPVSIAASTTALRADYLAYANCTSNPLAMVMVSSAIYPSLTGSLPAVMSALTYKRELRIVAPQANVPTISDDLQAPSLNHQSSPARTAINAGLDLAMYAQTEDGSTEAYQLLEQDVADGQISPERLHEAGQAILRLKQAIAGA